MLYSLQAYGLLAIAIITEVIGSSFLAKSDGFSKPIPTLVTLICYAAAFYSLSHVVKTIPLGITYAIWSGVGIVLTAIVGYFWLGNRLDLPAVLGMGLIIVGVGVIHVFSKATHL